MTSADWIAGRDAAIAKLRATAELYRSYADPRLQREIRPEMNAHAATLEAAIRDLERLEPAASLDLGQVCGSCGAHWVSDATIDILDDVIEPWRERALAAEALLAGGSQVAPDPDHDKHHFTCTWSIRGRLFRGTCTCSGKVATPKFADVEIAFMACGATKDEAIEHARRQLEKLDTKRRYLCDFIAGRDPDFCRDATDDEETGASPSFRCNRCKDVGCHDCAPPEHR